MVYEFRRPTRMWVRVIVRRCRELGIRIEVLREGEPTRGAVAVALDQGDDRFRVVTQSRDAEGEICWLPVFGDRQVSRPETEAYLERAALRDPDLWFIEIEEPMDPNPFMADVFRA